MEFECHDSQTGAVYGICTLKTKLKVVLRHDLRAPHPSPEDTSREDMQFSERTSKV